MAKKSPREITIKIIRAVLEDVNGFTESEIIRDNLAEECEGSTLFQRIQEIIEKNIK